LNNKKTLKSKSSLLKVAVIDTGFNAICLLAVRKNTPINIQPVTGSEEAQLVHMVEKKRIFLVKSRVFQKKSPLLKKLVDKNLRLKV
jgi:hypothetical protein